MVASVNIAQPNPQPDEEASCTALLPDGLM
jgi:hypothetical protein